MKIGILTYHRAHNYGALLQAVALRVLLQEMGNEVYYVDYWPDYRKYKLFDLRLFKKKGLKGKWNDLIFYITSCRTIKKRFKAFEVFIENQISPWCKPTNEKFDIVIIGSDQVWRWQKALNNYDANYFGDNNFKAKRQLSYAASMGIIPDTELEKREIAKLLSHLGYLSVREQSLKLFINSLGLEAEVHLDPSLLLTQQQWDAVLPSKPYDGRPYLLFYDLQKGVFDENQIQNFAKKRGLEIIRIVGKVRRSPAKGEKDTTCPSEFISLVRNAQFVFTSSYHGLSFALEFNKQFYASYIKNSSRAESLLQMLNLDGRLLAPHSVIPVNPQVIDYTIVNHLISGLRATSLNYLSSITETKEEL